MQIPFFRAYQFQLSALQTEPVKRPVVDANPFASRFSILNTISISTPFQIRHFLTIDPETIKRNRDPLKKPHDQPWDEPVEKEPCPKKEKAEPRLPDDGPLQPWEDGEDY